VGYHQELDQETAVPARISGSYINEISTQLVEALRYKPEGRGFDCRWGNLTQSFRPHYGLASNQPLTEMSIRDIPGG